MFLQLFMIPYYAVCNIIIMVGWVIYPCLYLSIPTCWEDPHFNILLNSNVYIFIPRKFGYLIIWFNPDFFNFSFPIFFRISFSVIGILMWKSFDVLYFIVFTVIKHLVKFQHSSDFVCRKIMISCFWLQFCSFLAIFVGLFCTNT